MEVRRPRKLYQFLDPARRVLDWLDERADLDIVACRRPERIELGWLFPGEPYTRLVVELRPVAADRTLVVSLPSATGGTN